MSIELNVYSNEPVLDRDRVIEESLFEELPAELKWEVRFPDVPSGPLSSGMVVGWRPESPNGAKILAALDSQNERALDDLSGENQVASVYLSVVTAADEEEWDDIIESASETVTDRKHRKYLESAEVFYSVETSARRNGLSIKFQEQLWRLIGVLSHGLMEDPQEEEFELFEE